MPIRQRSLLNVPNPFYRQVWQDAVALPTGQHMIIRPPTGQPKAIGRLRSWLIVERKRHLANALSVLGEAGILVNDPLYDVAVVQSSDADGPFLIIDKGSGLLKWRIEYPDRGRPATD